MTGAHVRAQYQPIGGSPQRAGVTASPTDTVFACRSCGSTDVGVFLALGMSPLANGILKPGFEHEEKTFPLDVGFCRRCSLVQLTFAPPPEDLFLDYPYFSSFSDAMVEHARRLTAKLTHERGLDGNSLVVELASNDGYLLRFYRDAEIPVLGIEPALNIAEVARDRGIETISEFFDADVGALLAAEGRRADVIHAHNVLAHVPDLNGFVLGIKTLLKPNGIAVIEVPYLRDLIENTEFDTIYHEHLSYFSLTALERLFSRHGMKIIDAERVAIHGGTLRITVGHDTNREEPRASVAGVLAEEGELGMTAESYYRDFRWRVETLKSNLIACLSGLKAEGHQIAGYGASAKGTTLLTYCGIGTNYLDFLVDRSTAKQGHLAPGSHLPIYRPEHLVQANPDYTLLLVWNFADEILAQQAEYRSRGGKFIVPVPSVRVV